ncbi:flagellar hook-length control protein FliK [Janthinobacterium sp. RB2R34]|uniref:flagellar hook-length control protein FliK n=1 Tax=Janthinobacterium sp. RB2R34 TaxID=3424193 RepID=UPI003F27BD74
MNTVLNFKTAGLNAADSFGTMAVTVGSTPLNGGGTAYAANGAGPTVESLPPALPGIPSPATPLFADALGDAAHSARPVAGAPAKMDEPEQPSTDGGPALPQEVPLPSMAAPWLLAQVTATSAAPLRDGTDRDSINDMAAPAIITAAERGTAPVAARAATNVTTAPVAAAIPAPAAPSELTAVPVRALTTTGAAPAATTTTAHLAVRPVAIQFNAQLGTLVRAPQQGEPLAAAMPAPAGETKTAAPAARGKAMPAAMEVSVAAVQPAVAATLIAGITPVAVATFAPGSVPAVPATGEDDLAASTILSITPAVSSARTVGNSIAADTAVEGGPAPHPHAGAADTTGMPARAATVGASFAATIASNTGNLDTERNGAAATALVTPAIGPGMTAPAAANALPAQGSDVIKLNGPAQQWQEPLREALGERLQTQIGRNSEHAVIRLDPPMLGRIDISIRHAAGTLQVNVSASNPEVLRQLQGIGETMRTDLAQRQYTEVAVNISATPRSPAAQAFAEGDARGQRQPGRQQDEAAPGRALSDDTPGGKPYGATFAMHEREYN